MSRSSKKGPYVDIKLLGRTTQGVTIMRMNGDDKVVSIGLMPEAERTEE